jgi:hypothetical protein
VTATAHGTETACPPAGARRIFRFVPAAKNLVRLNRAAGYDVEEQALPALHTEHLRHRIREVLARAAR